MAEAAARPDPSGDAGGELKREAAIIFSAALLPGTQSGRASLELPETPWCGQSWIAQREGTEKVRTGTSSFTATATLDHPHVLSNARHPVCGGLTTIYVHLLMIGLIWGDFGSPNCAPQSRLNVSNGLTDISRSYVLR